MKAKILRDCLGLITETIREVFSTAYPRIHISMHILQSILKYVTRSWYPVSMCDVRVSKYPGIHVFHCVSAYPLLNIVKSLPGEGWYFRLRIRVSSLFRGAASKWQGILQLSRIFCHTWCSVLCLNEAILNACNDCGQFEKDSSVSVVVNVENKESIKDWQLQSCCAKLGYCGCLKGCRHVVLRDGEVSSVSAKQLKGALQENIFENEAQPCVIVDIDNKESVDDLQFRSRYAKFVYCKSVRRRHQRDREPSRIPVKQLSRALHKSRHFRKFVRKYIKKNVPKSSAMHLFTKLSVLYRKLDYMFVRPRSAVKKRSMKRKWCTAHQRKKPKRCGRRVKVKCNYTSVRSVYKDVDHRMNHTEFKLCNDIEKNPGFIDHARTIQAPYSQGNVEVFGENARTQCVAMSLTSLIYNYRRSISSSMDLVNIVNIGNELYSG